MNDASRDTIQNVEKKLNTTDGFLDEMEGDLGKVFGKKGLNYQRTKTTKLVIPTKPKSILMGL
jgi:predicted RNA-binding protein YlqC (UPF0109 family)